MLVLKTSMSREGALATNTFNELERSQVLESNVLLANNSVRTKDWKCSEKLRRKRICKPQAMEGKPRLPGKSFAFLIN